MVWFPVSRARKLALSDGLCGCFVNTKLHASRLECFSNQQLLEMEESSACGFLETQWQAQHCHRRKETNCANRLETTALQLSMSWLKTPPPTLQRPQQRLDSISSSLPFYSYAHEPECLFLKNLRHTFYKKRIWHFRSHWCFGLLSTRDVGHCRTTWQNIIRLANLFSSEMFWSHIYSKIMTSRHLNVIHF